MPKSMSTIPLTGLAYENEKHKEKAERTADETATERDACHDTDRVCDAVDPTGNFTCIRPRRHRTRRAVKTAPGAIGGMCIAGDGDYVLAAW